MLAYQCEEGTSTWTWQGQDRADHRRRLRDRPWHRARLRRRRHRSGADLSQRGYRDKAAAASRGKAFSSRASARSMSPTGSAGTKWPHRGRSGAMCWSTMPGSACLGRPTRRATPITTGSWGSTSAAWSTAWSPSCPDQGPGAGRPRRQRRHPWRRSCPGPQAGIYTASKFAVRGLTECLRYNLAPLRHRLSLMCPGLTRTNAWDSALRRPAAFAASGFAPVASSELAQFGAAFEAGMDPLEVGHKTLAGMLENRALILTHPEFAQDFEEIYRACCAALPAGAGSRGAPAHRAAAPCSQ